MRRILRRAVVVGVTASTAAGAIALFSHGIRAVVLDAWLLAIAAVLLLALVRVTRLLAPREASPLEQALARMHPEPIPIPELALARDVELSRASELHFHVRLRPVLRQIAAHRLRSRYGIELDREPGRARDLLPSLAWSVVDPDRPLPEDRLGPGPSVQSLCALVDELERV